LHTQTHIRVDIIYLWFCSL